MIAEALFRRRERAAINQQLGHPMAGTVGWWGGAPTLSGVSVDENSAMNYSACWAATRLLCGTIGWLPFNLYREKRGGGKEIAWDHPVHRIIYGAPNTSQSSVLFRSSRAKDQINAGNGYAEIERNNRGDVLALHPMNWARVTPKEGDNGLAYEVRNKNGSTRVLESTEVFHVQSLMSDDGVVGKGVIQAARETVGFGMATEQHGAAYFGNKAVPTILLKHPGALKPEARTNIRKDFKDLYGGVSKAGEVALLQEGMEAQVLSVSPEDSQFLQTRQHNVEEIARWYGVPPHMIQHLMRSTYNNIEHQSIEFVTHSLIPWLKVWEVEVWRKLLNQKEQETYFAKFNVDALLRGDAASRTEALVKQFRHGNLDLDTWAEIEDRNPIGGEMGKARFIEQNMTTVQRAVEGQPEPVQTITSKPQADPADDTTDDTEDDSEARAAVIAVFDDVVSLMVRKEIEAAERAAKQPEAFLVKVEAFYFDQRGRMETALSRPLSAVRAVCGKCHPLDAMVESHCETSRQRLVEASEVPASELTASVAKCVAEWPNRKIEPLLSEVVE